MVAALGPIPTKIAKLNDHALANPAGDPPASLSSIVASIAILDDVRQLFRHVTVTAKSVFKRSLRRLQWVIDGIGALKKPSFHTPLRMCKRRQIGKLDPLKPLNRRAKGG